MRLMAKGVMRFFTRTTWNKVDIVWLLALILLALWVFEPKFSTYIPTTIEKEYIVSPHE
jgi:hypothetical protein